MRYVSLDKVESGMQLGYDVYDSHCRTLIGADSYLTEHYIERLKEYGFEGVYIRDEFSEDIEIEYMISPQLRAEGQNCIKRMDIDGCRQTAKKMVEEITAKERISLDMNDIRSYDSYTYAHSVNVAVISCMIGIGFQMTQSELTNLVTAALMHDFGKLFIPEEILNKQERLTTEEFEKMKTHSTLSYNFICERWDLSSHVKVAVLFHHENVDGSGYPDGITGEEQTLMTKILHVADVYDALISKRPYKIAYSPQEASEYMMSACGTLFDEKVVEMLLKYVPLFPKGTEIQLSDGREGIIYENFGTHNLRPVVRLLDGTLLDLEEKDNLMLTICNPERQEQISIEKYENERKQMLGN